jgi:hypothetical protein
MRAHGLALLCLLPLLAACQGRIEYVRETVEVEVPVFVPLSEPLTLGEPEPRAPAYGCIDRGEATLCNEQLAQWFEDVRDWGRRGWQRVEEIRRLQPKTPRP